SRPRRCETSGRRPRGAAAPGSSAPGRDAPAATPEPARPPLRPTTVAVGTDGSAAPGCGGPARRYVPAGPPRGGRGAPGDVTVPGVHASPGRATRCYTLAMIGP